MLWVITPLIHSKILLQMHCQYWVYANISMNFINGYIILRIYSLKYQYIIIICCQQNHSYYRHCQLLMKSCPLDLLASQIFHFHFSLKNLLCIYTNLCYIFMHVKITLFTYEKMFIPPIPSSCFVWAFPMFTTLSASQHLFSTND